MLAIRAFLPGGAARIMSIPSIIWLTVGKTTVSSLKLSVNLLW